MMLPFYIRLKVKSGENRGVNLYLPLLILYILLLPLVLILIPLWLLYLIFTWRTIHGQMVYKIVPAAYALICATRGTELYVDSEGSLVILKII